MNNCCCQHGTETVRALKSPGNHKAQCQDVGDVPLGAILAMQGRTVRSLSTEVLQNHRDVAPADTVTGQCAWWDQLGLDVGILQVFPNLGDSVIPGKGKIPTWERSAPVFPCFPSLEGHMEPGERQQQSCQKRASLA